MTPEKVTELAQKAGIYVGKTIISLSPFDLQRFAQLVRNESLEDAAKMCDALATPERPQLAQQLASMTPDGSLPNLGALCFACGVEYDKAKAHGALYDVDVMMASFFSQFDRGFFSLPTQHYQFVPQSSKKKAKK